ncbi:copper amine oxidase N-terminal domain-containing protein [Coprothermobacteraceae bacterium]|nr:copper amine oxidase N-terminal domain-containing protein [Coprothermobacteraceae bacterium]
MDLSGLSDRLETGAILSLKGLLLSDDSGFVLQAIVDEHEDSVFPSVEVVDSQGTRIYSSTAAEHQIRFTRSGTYTLSVSVNTGPLQGVLSATKSIVVQDPIFHTITAVADEGSQILPSGSVSVKHGETKEFIIDASPGYVLKDVLVDGISIGVVRTYKFTNVTRDHTIQVVSEPVLDYVIKVVSSGGGSVYPGTTRVAHGGGVTFLITPFDGFRIKDVLVDGVSIGPVETYTFLPVFSDHTLEVIFEPSQTNIVLHIGDKTFYVDGYPLSLDSPPIIKNGRTLLPIRAIVEALGGQVGWDANQKKVTVTLGSNRVELWIGKNTALVNGRQVMIDATNPKVVPEIINGRTMLPLRFVAESLGCSVEWDGNTQTVRVTYQKP